MGNYTSHYFGAYLEVTTLIYKKMMTVFTCENEHIPSQRYTNSFCPVCGKIITEKELGYDSFPSSLVDEVVGEEWEDVLRDISPEKAYDTGRIVCVGNGWDDWLYITKNRDYPIMKEFPSDADILKMKIDFSTAYKAIIDEIEKSPLVAQVEIKAGYVLDHEY